ncbi:alpha/beta fold hydrolase [Streptomyces sp. NPDC090303]|uniref:alpha/beta fold hydrolase n=1 Tax=Streptomyces sp. NPDC090303 TaxID=3365960 RepID=UPI0037FFB6D9
MTDRRLLLTDFETTVRDEGAGRTCVLIHGSPLDLHAWDGLVPLLSDHRRVLAPDLRGHGSASAGRAAEAVRDCADDLVVLLDLLGIPVVDLVGHSFGGQVAQQFGLTQPGRVDSMMLLCTRATPFPAFHAAAGVVEKSGADDSGATVARWFPPGAMSADVPAVRYARDCVRSADASVWAWVLRMIAVFDVLDALPGLDVPVSAVAAEHDRVATPDAVRRMADAVPGGSFHLLKGAYHLAPVLDPRAVAAPVLRDLTGRGGTPRM